MDFIKETNGESLEGIIKAGADKPTLEDITLIIPTLGRPILEACLGRIILGSCWPRTLIVVHQGDQPNIQDWVNHIQETAIKAIYIHSEERGKPAAINLAFANTQTKFACMIDDDCFVDVDWLQNMYSRLEANPDCIITGRVEPAGNETIAIIQLREAVVYSRPRLQFDLFAGGNMGASLNVIRRIGPFDEDPLLRYAAEDIEWAYRALRRGVSIAYAPEVAVSHFSMRTENEKFERLKSYAYGHGSFYGKYLRKGDWFIFLMAVIHFVRVLRRWIYGKMMGKMDHRLSGQAYCMGLLPGIIAGFRSRIRSSEFK